MDSIHARGLGGENARHDRGRALEAGGHRSERHAEVRVDLRAALFHEAVAEADA